MAKDINVSLKQITGEVNQQDKAVKNLAKSWADIEKTIGKITSQMGANGGNKMSGSLAKMSVGEKFGIGMAAAGSIFQAGMGALPSTESVISRATGYYNAGVMQGGNATMGQGAMYNRLKNGLGKFGIQSPMATAQLAQFYGQRGVTMGGGYEAQLTAGVGGAARYLNMDTNRAAAALEGLSAGAGGQSANLLRTMGIFTADPRTGAVKSQKEIFAEISGRLTAGRGAASVTDVQESFRRGNLGSFLKNSGLSEDQQQMYYLSELYKADSGKELDLSNRKEVDAAMKGLEAKGLVNPQQELNAIAASEEGVMQAGQASYIAGLKAAVPVIETLNKGMEGLAASVGGLKAAIDAIGSTNVGGAAGGLFGELGGAAVAGVSSYLGGKMGAGGKAGGLMAAAGKVGSVALKGLGAAGGLVGVGLGTSEAYSNAKQGNTAGTVMSVLGATASGALTGAAIGSIIPGLGTGIGALIGGGIGLVSSGVGAFAGGRGGGYEGVGGATDTSGTRTSAKGKGAAPKFVRPASGKITSGFGPRTPPTKGASSFHKGVDIANSAGTPIGAAADGKVTFSGTNGGYGQHIKIDHAEGYTTTYSHMSKLMAKKGDTVVAGQRIGSMGTTGTSTGNHLHFEVLKGGAPIDPATVVPGLGGGSVKATINNTSRESAKTDSEKKYSYSKNFGSSGAANTNGSSGAIAALGYSASDTSEYLTTPASTVNIFGNFRSILDPKEDPTGKEGKGGPAAVGLGTTGGGGMVDFSSSPSKQSRGGIVINVNVKSASEAEARRFAKIVKETLEDDEDIMKIGRM